MQVESNDNLIYFDAIDKWQYEPRDNFLHVRNMKD